MVEKYIELKIMVVFPMIILFIILQRLKKLFILMDIVILKEYLNIPETGKIWTNEHGPRGGDEINIIEKGKNYGWPKITYGINYSGTTITKNKSLPNMEQPLYYWLPSIAPSSFEYISSDIYPEWKGSLLAGALVFKYVERIGLKNNKVISRSKIAEGLGRPRDVVQAPDGYIYVSIENKGVYKIVPKNEIN